MVRADSSSAGRGHTVTVGAQFPLRCWAEIDLAALERNLRLIRATLPKRMRYVAIVKADAYGHGLAPVATALMHAGADVFAVANISEAAAIRELSADWPILLLSPTLPDEDRHVADLDLSVTLSSHEELQRFDRLGRSRGTPISIHLKIDTGMGRLGVWHASARALMEDISRADGVALHGVFTHFSQADEDLAFTHQQREIFLNTLADLPQSPSGNLLIHADNSAGLASASEEESRFNAVRIGLLQFGVLPHPHSLLASLRTEPVLSFHTRLGLLKELPAGAKISYGATHVLRRRSRLGILTAGYGDGLDRGLSNRGEVLVRGQRCPILGRVCMDQTIVDLTDIPADLSGGEPVVLIGRSGEAEISVSQFSAWSETIAWETLCSITKRVPRIYRQARAV